MRVHPSARRHGIADGDALHALRHAFASRRFDRDGSLARTLLVGPDRAGNLVELVVLHMKDGHDILIHAMHMRSTYHELLRPHGC